jgi:hypothetical protein
VPIGRPFGVRTRGDLVELASLYPASRPVQGIAVGWPCDRIDSVRT